MFGLPLRRPTPCEPCRKLRKKCGCYLPVLNPWEFVLIANVMPISRVDTGDLARPGCARCVMRGVECEYVLDDRYGAVSSASGYRDASLAPGPGSLRRQLRASDPFHAANAGEEGETTAAAKQPNHKPDDKSNTHKRALRKKCSLERPSCSRCVHRGMVCVYINPRDTSLSAASLSPAPLPLPPRHSSVTHKPSGSLESGLPPTCRAGVVRSLSRNSRGLSLNIKSDPQTPSNSVSASRASCDMFSPNGNNTFLEYQYRQLTASLSPNAAISTGFSQDVQLISADVPTPGSAMYPNVALSANTQHHPGTVIYQGGANGAMNVTSTSEAVAESLLSLDLESIRNGGLFRPNNIIPYSPHDSAGTNNSTTSSTLEQIMYSFDFQLGNEQEQLHRQGNADFYGHIPPPAAAPRDNSSSATSNVVSDVFFGLSSGVAVGRGDGPDKLSIDDFSLIENFVHGSVKSCRSSFEILFPMSVLANIFTEPIELGLAQCAIAAHFQKNVDPAIALKYFTRARNSVASQDKPTLKTVQSAHILSQFAFYNGQTSWWRILSHKAFQMLQILRLNIDPGDLLQETGNSSDAEERRRTFWVVSTFARLSQLGVGADSRRNAESAGVFKPIDSVDKTRCTVRPIWYPIDNVAQTAPVVYLHNVAEMIFHFGETIQRTLIEFQSGTSDNSSAVLANKQINALKQKFSEWILQFPSDLRLNENSENSTILSASSFAEAVECASSCRTVLNLHIYAAESFLHRPALYFTSLLPLPHSSNADTVESSTSRVLESALLKCLAASRKIAHIAGAITVKRGGMCEEYLHAWPAFYEAAIVLWFIASRTSNEWLNTAASHVFGDISSDTGTPEDFCGRGKTSTIQSESSSRVSAMSGILVDDSESDDDTCDRRSRSLFSAMEMSRTGMNMSRSDETRHTFGHHPQSAPALSPIVSRRYQLRALLRDDTLELLKILNLFEDQVNFGLKRFGSESTTATSMNMITPAVESVLLFLHEIEASLQSARFIGGWICSSAAQVGSDTSDAKCPGAFLGLLGADISLDTYGGDASIGRWMCEDEQRWGGFWRKIQAQHFD
ncbi:hypothetical protein HDU82_000184 [Entophlyctis luteolus]|nr:hypothetical protein HDU82_000184 [Entophlyctis luteolus]